MNLPYLKRYYKNAFKGHIDLPQVELRREIERLQKEPRYQNQKSLVPYGKKIYSQNLEDGMIIEIFNRIGTTNKLFVEFGVGNGLENNTAALLLSGWRGLWIEGSGRNIKKIKSGFPNLISQKRLHLIHSFITKSNINQLISSAIQEVEVDFLSVDIDGNDYHVFNEIDAIKPRVVVIEYNSKFPPPVRFCISYSERFVSRSNDYFGASLKFLEEKFALKGYSLVGCDIGGANAFFVRSGLVKDKFHEPFSAENHFEPARYALISLKAGHPASYETIDNTVRDSV